MVDIVLKGKVKIIVYDAKGKIIRKIKSKNYLCYYGLQGVTALIGGLSTDYFKYVAVGDGDPTNPGNCTYVGQTINNKVYITRTGLGHELCRKLADVIEQKTTSVNNDTLHLEAYFTSDVLSGCGLSSRIVLCETGIFNASTEGTMLAYWIFSNIQLNVDTGGRVDVYWDVQIQ